MANIKVAVINRSTVLTDAQVAAAVPALQTQVSRDFAPAWGIDAELLFVPKGSEPAPDPWQLVLLDDSDQAGALGYHDLTAQGLPLGKVFAGTDLKLGAAWTVTVSHELLEMLGDPDINLTAFVPDGRGGGRLYAYENCDACEADQYAYPIDGVLVSDFVYPAWFESFRRPGSTQFDHQQKISRPFELLPGGYIGIYDVTAGTGWSQITAQSHATTAAAHPDMTSRRLRLRADRDRWQPSEVKTAGTAA